MLTKRIIPCLDVDCGRVVKGISFVQLRDAGDPAELASVYDQEGGDELVFLDITASSDSRNTMVDVVSRVSEEVFHPTDRRRRHPHGGGHPSHAQGGGPTRSPSTRRQSTTLH